MSHTELSSLLITSKLPKVPYKSSKTDAIAIALRELQGLRNKELKRLNMRIDRTLAGIKMMYSEDLKNYGNNKYKKDPANLAMVFLITVLQDYPHLNDEFFAQLLNKSRTTIFHYRSKWEFWKRYPDIAEMKTQISAMWKSTLLE